MNNTMEFLEKCNDQEKREFWKMYKTLEKDHLLLEAMKMAAKLDDDDLRELTEYATWLKEESSTRYQKPKKNAMEQTMRELEAMEDTWADRAESDPDSIALTVKNMLTSLCRDVEKMMFGKKSDHNLMQTRLDFYEVIGVLFMKRAKAIDQAESDDLTAEIKELQRVTDILGEFVYTD